MSNEEKLEVENLKQEIKDLKTIADFLLDQYHNEHIEQKKGGCTPACPKCRFYGLWRSK